MIHIGIDTGTHTGFAVWDSEAKALTTKNCHTSQYLLNEDKTLCRLLTPNEYEKLQTLPLNYTEGIPNSERFKAIGNGWTIDVIAHIFSFLKKNYGETTQIWK